MSALRDDLQAWRRRAAVLADQATPGPVRRDVGVLRALGDGIALVSGLMHCRHDDLLRFAGGGVGMAVALEPDTIGVVLLSPWDHLEAGAAVETTGTVASVPVGDALFGRVIDPLGRPLDGGRNLPETCPRLPVERPAPPIIDRALVSQPLVTGITVLDALLPIGRGQRELIIGDRKTGKTTLAVDAMLNQARGDVVCVYVAIGQRASAVKRVIDAVQRRGAMARTIIVVAAADGPPGLLWLAPYAACSMAEAVRDAGGHALLVIDDLSKHAAIHRQISLLLRRPPGREAYPGDVFYAHSRLLERGAKLSEQAGGGSLSILPIAETQAGNLSAYIPTNLISITDGQVLLEPRLFHAGQRPAVNVGKSVSRVGGKAQVPVLKELAGRLRLSYAQFLELEVFTRFGGMADARTRQTVTHGRRIRAILSQPQHSPRTLPEQAAALLAIEERLLDGLSLDAVETFKRALPTWLPQACPEAVRAVEATGHLDDRPRAALLTALRAWMGELT